jgi:Protein of unknown function (DUF3810)
MHFVKRQNLLPYFLLIQIILIQFLGFSPEVVERWYSNGLYPIVSKSLRMLFGNIPFSVGDLLYFLLIVFGMKWIWTNRKSWKTHWKKNIHLLLSGVAVLYFAFHLLWGFNYYRQPLFEKMKIERDYTDSDLLLFTKKLIAKTNAIQFQIIKNKNAKIEFPYSQEQVFTMNLNGYRTLANEYPFFNYSELSAKQSLFSLPLTFMGFGGYLNPFTNEAQVNYLMPMYNSPTTSCHEMAHQMGYASESECNFIGFMASVKNNNLYFKYSGYSFALRYCLANWQVRNEVAYKQLLQTVHPGILKNYDESDAFWKTYETPVETGFHLFYDTFLKWNQQKDGMEGYSKFVNLMVNYYQNKPL